MNPSSPQHIAWVDYLRIAACFLVIVAHCCDPFVANFENQAEFLSGVSWGSFVRCCVPLFVMISGVLLLPVQTDTVTFYRKRMKRILIPLAIWSLALPVCYYLYFKTGVTSANPYIDPANFTGESTLTKMYTFIFNFNYDITPLWYLYMLVGLYLIIPVIGPWARQAARKEIKFFLLIWGFAMCIPYIQMAAPALGYQGNGGNMGLWGVCDWNAYGAFYYFSGFLGYIVLAHYLVRFPLEWSWKKTLSIAVPLFASGYAISLYGFLLVQKAFPGDFPKLEIIWYFAGINVFMMTFAVFIVFQKIKAAPSPWVSRIASLTFGVYLFHFFVVQVFYDLLYPNVPLPAWLMIPFLALVVFIASLAVGWLLCLNRWTRKSIM